MDNLKTYYSILSNKYQLRLTDVFKFELKSLYGRAFLSKYPKLYKQTNLLNLGCGFNIRQDWVNADFYRNVKFWKKYEERLQWRLDLRYPLKCHDNVWDGIFCEHAMEHLYPNQVLNLLKEFHRTIKKNSWLRIVVPDLQKYVDYYNGNLPHETFKRWGNGCEAIRSITQNYFHNSVWDFKLMEKFLLDAGFGEIKKVC